MVRERQWKWIWPKYIICTHKTPREYIKIIFQINNYKLRVQLGREKGSKYRRKGWGEGQRCHML